MLVCDKHPQTTAVLTLSARTIDPRLGESLPATANEVAAVTRIQRNLDLCASCLLDLARSVLSCSCDGSQSVCSDCP